MFDFLFKAVHFHAVWSFWQRFLFGSNQILASRKWSAPLVDGLPSLQDLISPCKYLGGEILAFFHSLAQLPEFQALLPELRAHGGPRLPYFFRRRL